MEPHPIVHISARIAHQTTANAILTSARPIVTAQLVANTPQSLVLSNGFSITPTSEYVEVSAASGIASDGTEAIANGTFPGQRLEIVNTGVNEITFVSGANVRLAGGGNRVMGQFDSLTLRWSSTIGDWVESGTNN